MKDTLAFAGRLRRILQGMPVHERYRPWVDVIDLIAEDGRTKALTVRDLVRYSDAELRRRIRWWLRNTQEREAPPWRRSRR